MRLKSCLQCEEELVGPGLQRLCLDCLKDHKWCPRCEEIKPRTAFQLPNGRAIGYCYPCLLAERRDTNKTPEKKRWAYARHLKRKFGISQEEADKLIAVQACEVCGQPKDGDTSLHVEHCHTSGKIRGVVCPKCNRAIAVLEADPMWLKALETYLFRTIQFS